MPTDGTVYTISDTSAATHRPPPYNRLIDDYHALPSQFHNTRPNLIQSLGPDVRTQHGLSQPGNQMVRPETPPPTYQDYISGATSATFVWMSSSSCIVQIHVIKTGWCISQIMEVRISWIIIVGWQTPKKMLIRLRKLEYIIKKMDFFFTTFLFSA